MSAAAAAVDGRIGVLAEGRSAQSLVDKQSAAATSMRFQLEQSARG